MKRNHTSFDSANKYREKDFIFRQRIQNAISIDLCS